MRLWIVVCFIVLLLTGFGYYEYSVWQECLTTNHWWYCLRILSHD